MMEISNRVYKQNRNKAGNSAQGTVAEIIGLQNI